jgi:membrane fusion protein, multidrug efflux system
MIRWKRVSAYIVASAAVAVAAGCGNGAAQQGGAPAPAPVVVAQAVRRTVPVTLREIGNVEPMAKVDLRSRVAGAIVAVRIADGADVREGQELFRIDPDPFRIALEQAQAQLARDQALLGKANDDVARYAKLVEKEYVTREQYESAKSQSASLAATIQADQAAVDQAKLNLAYCTIRAPIAGRVGSVNLRAGNLVKVNDDPPLVTILKVRPVYVTFSVPEKNLPEVRARAARGPLSVRAWNRGESGDGHEGKLVFIDNAVDAQTGSIRLKGEFNNADRALWPGQFVEVALQLSEQKDAVVVPSPAVQVGQQGSYVFVVGADGTAQVRPVVVMRTVGDESVIASGLDGGETVITDGQLRVVPGSKVAIQQAPAPVPAAS